MQMKGVQASVDERYAGRMELLDRASVRLSDIRKADEGYYECSVRVFGTRPRVLNITTLYLHVDSE